MDNVFDVKLNEIYNNKSAGLDIKEHLPTLKEYSMGCDVIVEMGVRSIVSTWAFLAGYPTKLTSMDIVNPTQYQRIPCSSSIEDVMNLTNKTSIEFEFILGDTRHIMIDNCDLLFIDTLHVYDQLIIELSLHAVNVNKWIILHDTTTFGDVGELDNSVGLKPAIDEFIESHNDWVVHKVFTNNNGLTILKRV